MYNIADKMITGCKLDFAIFASLMLQIPIACFDMKGVDLVLPPDHKGLVTRNTNLWLLCGALQHLYDITHCVNYAC